MSDEIKVNEKYLSVFAGILDELHVSYTIGKTWTTDAIYREMPEKIRRRKERGCICVDMECGGECGGRA